MQSGLQRRAALSAASLPPAVLLAALLGGILGGCSFQPLVPWSRDLAPLSLGTGEELALVDGRGRFREIFCAVNRDHGESLPDHRPCEEALTHIGIEPPATGAPAPLGASEQDLLVLMVPGFGYQCVKNWLDHDYSAPLHLAEHGYQVELLEVNGLASSAANAAAIREFIANLPPGKAGRCRASRPNTGGNGSGNTSCPQTFATTR
jgi:hypothetical protein